jgi:hypothetical protein
MRFMQIFASCSLFSHFSAIRTLAQALNAIQPETFRFYNGFKLNLTAKGFHFQGLIATEVT